MVKIITGQINTGKTSWLLEDFKRNENADGFASSKVRVNGEHIGYELIHLKTGEKCQFIRKINHIPDGWNEKFRLGMHYSFNEEGIAFAEKIVKNAIANKVKLFYLDEVARLEVKGQGFANILKQLLESKIDLVLVVREDMIESICNSFNIKNYSIFNPSENRK